MPCDSPFTYRSPSVHPSPTASSRRIGLLRLAAAAVLALGYLDLVRGGTTLAPLLLAAGYLVLVPALIVTWR